jgi:Zn-dependent M16 (insulinase) family peptidase
MEERKELEKAIQELEAQRENLGDVAVEAALAGLYQKLSKLESPKTQTSSSESKTDRVGERRVVTVLFCDVAG